MWKTLLILLAIGSLCVKLYEDHSWIPFFIWGANFIFWFVIWIKELFFDE